MEFKGCSVFIDCGNFGIYQGKVADVDAASSTITLVNVMKDGASVKGKVTVNAAEITDIKVLQMASKNETPPRKSKTIAIKSKIVEQPKVVEPPPPQSSSAKPEVTEAPKVQNTLPRAPWHVTPQNEVNDSNRIMQQLFTAPPSVSQTSPVKNDPVKVVEPAQKENKMPIQPLMMPTAAFRILKRGEPMNQSPQSSVNGKPALQKNQDVQNIKSQDKAPLVSKTPKAPVNDKGKNKTNDQATKKVVVKPQTTPQSSLSKSGPNKPVQNVPTKIDAIDSTFSASTPVPGGIRMDPQSLISALAIPIISPAASLQKAPSVSPQVSPRKVVPERSLSVNDQPLNKPQFEKFGDFKYFTEKQAPKPCNNVKASSQRSRGNTRSPSGNPTTDFSNGYGRVHRKNRDLNGPIDHDTFKTDFDFDANLALFVREEDEDEEDTSDEAPAHIRNFRNDENIIGDPARVTSWTANLHEFQHTSLMDTQNGCKIPVLSVAEKEKFLSIVSKKLGEETFNILIADNLLAMILDVLVKNNIEVKNIVILGSKTTNIHLINRLAMHLSNRQFHGIFVDCSSRLPLPGIEFTDEAGIKKVVEDIQIIVNLEGVISPKLEIAWMNRVANGTASNRAHVISLEADLPQFASSHSLYLATLVESKPSSRKGSCDRRVADIGVPFSWFQDAACKALTQAFSKQQLISI